jgi:cAMP phosphodiesterase
MPMEIRVLGCNGGILPGFYSASFLIDNRVLIDAGHVAGALTMEEQNRVRDIFITHFHLDHTKDIAFLTDNAVGTEDLPIVIHGTRTTLSDFRTYYFNNILWPDFTRIKSDNVPVAHLEVVIDGKTETVKGLEITPFHVDHTVEGVGYIVRDKKGSVIFSGDTGPIDTIWDVINSQDDLKAVFVETSFPNSLQQIADSSRHFTPRTLLKGMAKVKKDGLPFYLYHLKPKYFDVLTGEIRELGKKNLHVLENDMVLKF